LSLPEARACSDRRKREEPALYKSKAPPITATAGALITPAPTASPTAATVPSPSAALFSPSAATVP
jgi:hypothetical protein